LDGQRSLTIVSLSARVFTHALGKVRNKSATDEGRCGKFFIDATYTLDEAIDGAIQADTIVFAIGIGDPKVSNGVNKNALKKLGSETGGQVYLQRTDDDLNNSFKRIERELRSQYVVAYVPHQTKPSGPYRRIRIEVTSPALKRNKLRLFYRKNYYVKPSFIKE